MNNKGVASVSIVDGKLVIDWGDRREVCTPPPSRNRLVIRRKGNVTMTAYNKTAYVPGPKEQHGQQMIFGEEARSFIALTKLVDKLLPNTRFKAICLNRPVERTAELTKSYLYYTDEEGQQNRKVITYYE